MRVSFIVAVMATFVMLAVPAFGQSDDQGRIMGSDTVDQLVDRPTPPPAEGTVITIASPQGESVGTPGPRGPQGPRGEVGPQGSVGQPGRTRAGSVRDPRVSGLDRRVGAIEGRLKGLHTGIDQDVKAWNPVSKSYVDARDAKLRAEMKTNSTTAPTGAKSAAQAATPGEGEENDNDMENVLLAVLATALAVGLIVFLLTRGQGREDNSGSGPTDPTRGSFDPQGAPQGWGQFTASTRAPNGATANLTATSEPVALADADARRAAADARVAEAAASAAARRQAIAGIGQPVLMGDYLVGTVPAGAPPATPKTPPTPATPNVTFVNNNYGHQPPARQQGGGNQNPAAPAANQPAAGGGRQRGGQAAPAAGGNNP